ncbi:MAG: DUF6292 family protein [Labedaea sp.]
MQAEGAFALERGLAGYVRAVAAELRVSEEATGFEISDTVTAYLGLTERNPDCPGRDLMLVWNQRDGWLVAVETRPAEQPLVVGYLGTADILPSPDRVAGFVAGVLGGSQPLGPRPAFPPFDSAELAGRLSQYVDPPPGPAPAPVRRARASRS